MGYTGTFISAAISRNENSIELVVMIAPGGLGLSAVNGYDNQTIYIIFGSMYARDKNTISFGIDEDFLLIIFYACLSWLE